MEISDREVLRYLGYRGSEADERVSALLKELRSEFLEKTVPKNVYGIWDCTFDSSTLTLDGMIVKSEKLSKHLSGCRRVVLLAATLGPEADTLIRRCSVLDMEKAVIAQAVCTAMIEAYCDDIEKEILQKYSLNGLNRTARFSPGYGDFDIAHQKDIINLLNCGKRIGLTLTNGYMLIPSKSVTALIGFSDEKKESGGKCTRCAAGHCESREA